MFVNCFNQACIWRDRQNICSQSYIEISATGVCKSYEYKGDTIPQEDTEDDSN
jgi:hypothetical protein